MRAANSNGEETEKAIREAAVKVIAKHGFQAASLREIAKEVGIRAPSLYNYIKSKEKLLYDLLKVPVSAMIADYETKTRDVTDPVARLQIYVQVHLDFHLNHRLEVFIGNMELRSLSSAHYRTIAALREEYATLLQQDHRRRREGGGIPGAAFAGGDAGHAGHALGGLQLVQARRRHVGRGNDEAAHRHGLPDAGGQAACRGCEGRQRAARRREPRAAGR